MDVEEDDQLDGTKIKWKNSRRNIKEKESNE